MLPASSLQDDGICCRWILKSLGGGYVYVYLMNLIPAVYSLSMLVSAHPYGSAGKLVGMLMTCAATSKLCFFLHCFKTKIMF
jgi:hypothetical protein